MAKKPKPSEVLGLPKSTSPAGRKRPSDHMSPGKKPAGGTSGRTPAKPAGGTGTMY